MSNSLTAGAHRIQKLAVVLHLFYEEQWPEFVTALANISQDFTLFISLRPESDFADQIRQDFPAAVVRPFPNLGRDVAPFLAWLPDLQSYDLVCKIHTKRSEGRHSVWRRVVIDGLLGSVDTVNDYISAFANDPELALGGARFNYVDGAGHVSVSDRALPIQHGPLPKGWGFFAGTMFWCRPKVFAGLDQIYPQDCFAAHGDTDGHPEHVVERALGLIVMQANKKIMLHDVDILVDHPSNLHGNPNWGDTYNAFQQDTDPKIPDAPIAVDARLSLLQLYDAHDGYGCDSWSGTLIHYDRTLRGMRNAPIRLLQVGVQNGGSLEVWGKYFSDSRIILGCDTDEKCAALHFDDPRIKVIQADAASPYAKTKIMQVCGQFDVIIDNSAAEQRDCIAVFLNYFLNLAEGGIYVVEGLCRPSASFFDPGRDPLASAFFRLLCDLIQRPDWAKQRDVQSRFAMFENAYDIDLSMFSAVQSVEFSNALIILRKGSGLGQRMRRGRLVPLSDIQWTDEDPQTLTSLINDGELSVSVVIPFQNGSAFLADAIRSVNLQTRPVHEIIVVDAGSDAGEALWLKTFATDAAFAIVTQDNTNLGAAVNLGVAAATGSHICLLDQTDIFHNHHNAALIDAWKVAKSTANRLGWIMANYRTVDEYFVDTALDVFAYGHDPVLIEDMIAHDIGLSRSAMILDKAAVLDVGGFDPRLRQHQDDDLLLRLFMNGYRGSFLASECASCRKMGHETPQTQADLDSTKVFFRKWQAQNFTDPRTELKVRANLKRRIKTFFQTSALRDGNLEWPNFIEAAE